MIAWSDLNNTSYQYHRVKDETIYLLSGFMDFEIELEGKKDVRRLLPGDCFLVSPGTRHRMVATESCDVLEVSTPELNDVVRLEDRYGRIRLDNHQGSHELLGRL